MVCNVLFSVFSGIVQEFKTRFDCFGFCGVVLFVFALFCFYFCLKRVVVFGENEMVHSESKRM